MNFGPEAFNQGRNKVAGQVLFYLNSSIGLTAVDANYIKQSPGILPILRMACSPPIAVDRLVGLSGAKKSIVSKMENCFHGNISLNFSRIDDIDGQLAMIYNIINLLLDKHLMPWLLDGSTPDANDLSNLAILISDRYCVSLTNAIMRNEQENRQLILVTEWLNQRGYRPLGTGLGYDSMTPGTYSMRLNVPGRREGKITATNPEGHIKVNIPIDLVVMPLLASTGDFPILIEAKSAGDFTNTNKRRKEEAQKLHQLRRMHGIKANLALLLCGYFNEEYIDYEESEGLTCIWDHKLDDLVNLGI